MSFPLVLTQTAPESSCDSTLDGQIVTCAQVASEVDVIDEP
jgi:hypothetical protein